MKRMWIAVSLGLLISATAQGAVIITEIMYNSAGSGDGATPPAPATEWVEIYNTGAAAVDISGWRIDDEDPTDWGTLPAGSSIGPGEVAIIANIPTEFNGTWGAGIKVFGVSWAALANTASATNEVLVLRDNTDAEVDMANYEAGTNGWPASTNGRSIYLKNINLDNNVGANWGLSEVGVDGAYSPATAVAPFSTSDVASPGFVIIPEPATLLLALGMSLAVVSRRRRS